jgi:LysM repeat protein
MAARSPARFLAPLALLGFVLALFLIVSHSRSDGSSTGNEAKTTQERSTSTPAGSGTSSSGKRGKRFYRVKAGDTPSAIAEKTGVPLSTIQQLNPDLDPQTLSPGQRIKLRK